MAGVQNCRAGWWVLAGLAVLAGAAGAALPPIPQPSSYHDFADRRTLLSVPNFLNVVSNAAFLWVGLAGLKRVLGRSRGFSAAFLESRERWPYGVLFLGLVLTAFGSAYYHLEPDNRRLVLDRLPIAVALTSLLSAVVVDRVDLRWGLRILPALVILGAGSVLYWHVTELRAAGDLRLYAILQAYSFLAVSMLVVLCPGRYTRGADLAVAALLYGLAKLFELLDSWFFSLGQLVSGHTLKHLTAALAVYWLLRMLGHRVALAPAQTGSSTE